LAEQKKLLVKVSLIIVNAGSLEHRRAAAATVFRLPPIIFWAHCGRYAAEAAPEAVSLIFWRNLRKRCRF
jgi:hypothetical protein